MLFDSDGFDLCATANRLYVTYFSFTKLRTRYCSIYTMIITKRTLPFLLRMERKYTVSKICLMSFTTGWRPPKSAKHPALRTSAGPLYYHWRRQVSFDLADPRALPELLFRAILQRVMSVVGIVNLYQYYYNFAPDQSRIMWSVSLQSCSLNENYKK